MKPTKLLIKLDERNMEIIKEVEAIAESMHSKPIYNKTPSKRNQQKLEELFVWLDATLEWATLLEREIMKELDGKLNANSDIYFSDYELHIKQYGKQLGKDEFDATHHEIIGYEPYTWVDHSLVFSEDILPEDDYKCQLDWRHNEKMNLLSIDILNFDSVTTSIEITHQYIVQIRAGKWQKVAYNAKRFGKDGEAMRMKDDENLPW